MDYDPAAAIKNALLGTPTDEAPPPYPLIAAVVAARLADALGEESALKIMRTLGALVLDETLPTFQAQLVELRERKVRMIVLAATEKGRDELTPEFARDIMQQARDGQAEADAAKARKEMQ